MTQSDKPRQLEPGEWLHDLLGPTISPCEWSRYLASAKAIYARAEAACIAKGREEAEAQIEELKRDVDAHRRHRGLLANDLIALAEGCTVTTLLGANVESKLAALQAAAPRWIPTSERLPALDDEVAFWWLGHAVIGTRVSERYWRTRDGEYYQDVTHYMPLPPLPSEET